MTVSGIIWWNSYF